MPTATKPILFSHCVFSVCLLLACGDPTGYEDDGELRVGLWGDSPSGQTYALHGAQFDVSGIMQFSTDQFPDGTSTISMSVPAGEWELTLLEGWRVMRGAVGENPVLVDAMLVSPNPVDFVIANNRPTEVTYVFEVDGEMVPLDNGSIDIDVEFEEDDGICQPEGLQTTLYAVTDDMASGHGEGWQSFTAPADVRIDQVWLDWIGDGTPGAVIQIREGLGVHGTLLGEAIFPGLAGLPMGVETPIMAPITPIEIVEDGVYTLVGEDASGWKTSAAAFPGAVSSEGNTTIFNFTLRGSNCG